MELNPKQQEAVNYEGGPLLIVAGAGSGKTKTLTGRVVKIISKGASPSSVLAITFTNKAAKEIKDRIMASGINLNQGNSPFLGTFHSFGARILKEEADKEGRNKNFTIFDGDDSLSLIKKIMKQYNISKEKYKPSELLRDFSAVKSEMLKAEGNLETVPAKLFEEYEEELKKNNAFDFDDLIEKPVKIFMQNPEVLKKYQDRYKHILIDEYQDTNSAQYNLVKLLAEKHRNLTVVGDDAQAIYSFRGADYRNFLNFERDYPGTKVIKLEENYRSSGNIIRGASGVIKYNKNQKPKELWTSKKEGEPIRIVSAKGQEQEAEFIAKTIKDTLKRGDANKSIAILYRTNAQSRAIEQALIRADIAYKIFGGLKFYERKEIKDIISGLRLASNPFDSVSVERIKKTFYKAVAEKVISNMTGAGNSGTGILDLINTFLGTSDYFAVLKSEFGNFRERIENINELISYAGSFSSLPEFLEQVSLLQSSDEQNKKGLFEKDVKVNLMTIHLSKGLEFGMVFLCGVTEGILPHERSYAVADDMEEERRLMYVSMTRAKEELYITYSSVPSRFIYEIPQELVQVYNFGGVSGRFEDDDSGELPDEDERYIEYD